MTLEELEIWVDEIKNTPIDDNNINVFKSFIKFSPEKMADRLDIDRSILTKEFDKHKKEIHKKIIIFNKSKELMTHEPNIFGFNYDGLYVRTIKSICINYYEIFYKNKIVKFYPMVKYLYYDLGDNILIFPMYESIRRIYVSRKEFYENFSNLREYKINKLISINNNSI